MLEQMVGFFVSGFVYPAAFALLVTGGTLWLRWRKPVVVAEV